MKKNLIYGLMLAVAFLLSSASFASPSISGGYVEPAYDVVAFTADTDDPVMSTAKAVTFGLTNYKYNSYVMYAHFKVTDDRMPRTALVRSFESEPIEVPTRIPVAV